MARCWLQGARIPTSTLQKQNSTILARRCGLELERCKRDAWTIQQRCSPMVTYSWQAEFLVTAFRGRSYLCQPWERGQIQATWALTALFIRLHFWPVVMHWRL